MTRDSLVTRTLSGIIPEEVSTPQSESADSPVPSHEGDKVGIVHLRILDGGQVIDLREKEEYTLGRSTGDRKPQTELDLSPYNAHDLGVSRRHAVLRIRENDVILKDIGSSNGTSVNGQKVPTHVESVLKNGDIF